MTTFINNSQDIDNEILLAQEKVKELQEIKKKQEELSEDKRLAEDIHSITCHWNHTDGCGWYWESDSGWNGGTHKNYLKKAQKMLKLTDAQTAVKIIKISKEL